MPKGQVSKRKLVNARIPTKLLINLAAVGLTDGEIAEVLGIANKTLSLMKQNDPRISEALESGRKKPTRKLEQSLFNRGIGMEVSERSVEVYKNSKGKVMSTKEKEVVKQIPPDPKCIEFWLVNRLPERWKKTQNVLLSGNLTFRDMAEIAKGN